MTGLSLKPQGLSREFIRIGQAAATESAQIEAGLRLTNILGAQERMIGFVDEEPWHRGGGETYVADSLVLVSGIEDLHRHVLAKAFVSIGTPLDAKLDSLLRRRKLVSEMGIPVPRLYSAREATIFEEFIDFPVIAAELVDEAVLEQIGEIGAHLDWNGFSTLSFLSDLRIKNGRVYYVDFGFDLGEPSDVRSNCARATIEKAILNQAALDCCLRSYSTSLQSLRVQN